MLARRARRVVTVSEFSRAELAELLGADAGRVSVVPGGVDARFTPRRGRGRARAARSGSSAPTSSAWPPTPRARTSARSCPPPARSRPTASSSWSRAVTGRSSRPSRGWTGCGCSGHVDDALLPGLYAGAEAFALPSLYEGFGLPVLEAMAAGTPVLTTDRGRAAGDLRRRRAARRGPGRLRAPSSRRCSPTPPSASVCAPPDSARAAGFSWERTAREIDALLQDELGAQAG